MPVKKGAPSNGGADRSRTEGSKDGSGSRDAGRPRRGRRLWRWRRLLFALALLVVAGFSTFAYWVSQIPLPEEEPLLQTTFVCAADVVEDCDRDNSLAQLSGGEDRVTVTFEELPPVLIQAVLSAEDRDFFDHGGVDPVGIGRALWADVRSQGVQQGGSTITQQYVKNVYLGNERTLVRKVNEAVLAVKLERELDKEEILVRYLNTIYFGRGAYGVQAASRAYFGKDVSDIGIAEAAYLAGLIRSPESADAWREADRTTETAQAEQAEAERRRRTVLAAMLEERYIDQATYDEADAVPFDEPYLRPREEATNFGVVRGSEYGTEYFVEYVRRTLRQQGFTDAEIFGGGLRVYTTLDFDMQEAAYRAVTETLDREGDPDAGLVAIDQQGRVRAMMGGRDWEASQVNLAVGVDGGGTGRQPGSAFKPFVLAEAIEQDISVESPFSSPAEIVLPDADGGQDWEVSNYGDASHGTLTLADATHQSSNTVYAQLMEEVGPAEVVDLAHRMGIESELPEVPALVLGTAELSVLEMTAAYSTFANEGERIPPLVVTRVEDSEGNVLASFGPQREQVIDPTIAQTVNWVLRGVIEDGTGERAWFGQTAAGKTGTTQRYRDAWFMGYTCELTAGVWMGYTDANEDGSPRYMSNVHGREVAGGTFPAEIWSAFMDEATEDLDDCPMSPPLPLPGEIINPELVTTTTFEVEETTTTDTEPPDTTTTTESVPSTTAPPSTPPPTPPPTPAPTSTVPTEPVEPAAAGP